jgi:hypothetical protein
MRLKEHHCISPQEPVPAGGPEDDLVDDGIRNAWFPRVDLTAHGVRPLASPGNLTGSEPFFFFGAFRIVQSSFITVEARCEEQSTKRTRRAAPTRTMRIHV